MVGGGFAGVECAWQLARRGHGVRLVEMRPVRKTDAHETDRLAEMVCSNSFRSDNPQNAVGLLKREMELDRQRDPRRGPPGRRPGRRCPRRRPGDLRRGSDAPARGAAGDRPRPGGGRDARGSSRDRRSYVVVATGPLTSEALAASLKEAPRRQLPLFLRRGGAGRGGLVARPARSSSRASRWGRAAATTT